MKFIAVYTPSTKTLAIFLAAILLVSCSPYRKLDNRTAKLHNTLLGKWQVNKRIPKPGNNIVRPRGLLTGTVIFYPNNSFMYKNKDGRYTGNWEVASFLDWDDGPSNGTYKVSLWFNGEMPKYHPGVTMEMIYARKNKMKFIEGYTTVNILKR